jgi:hypothetical protein
MNPHVIFQFSWGNKLEKEKLAIDDMSIYGGQGDDLAPLGRPNVLYLIKALRKGGSNAQPDSPVYGFVVYVVRQGDRTAANPTFRYRVGVTKILLLKWPQWTWGCHKMPTLYHFHCPKSARIWRKMELFLKLRTRMSRLLEAGGTKAFSKDIQNTSGGNSSIGGKTVLRRAFLPYKSVRIPTRNNLKNIMKRIF